MADIDMIPRSYREALHARRTLARYGAALALLAVAGTGGGALLRWRLAVEAPRLEQLRAASSQVQSLRARLAQAQQQKDALARDARALAALRGTGEAAALSLALDAALNDKVWIERLVFSRTQELLHDPLPDPATPGTVRARAPATAGAPGVEQSWRLASHVEIAGLALDQAAMAAFLAALAASPLLADVRFLNSKAAADGVSFNVAGSLRPAGQAR